MGIRDFFGWKPQAEKLKAAEMSDVEAKHLGLEVGTPESGVYKVERGVEKTMAEIHDENEEKAVDRTAAEIVKAQMEGNEHALEETLSPVETHEAGPMELGVDAHEAIDPANLKAEPAQIEVPRTGTEG